MPQCAIIAEGQSSFWNFYPSRSAAEADLPRAADWYKQKVEILEGEAAIVARARAIRSSHLGNLKAIDASERAVQLEVMPPLDWHQDGQIDRFLVDEPVYGSIYVQVAQLGDLCASKQVDRNDPDTWITTADFTALSLSGAFGSEAE